jgi:hypothetical protein
MLIKQNTSIYPEPSKNRGYFVIFDTEGEAVGGTAALTTVNRLLNDTVLELERTDTEKAQYDEPVWHMLAAKLYPNQAVMPYSPEDHAVDMALIEYAEQHLGKETEPDPEDAYWRRMYSDQVDELSARVEVLAALHKYMARYGLAGLTTLDLQNAL